MVQGTECGEIDTEFFQPPPDQATAPTFRKAVGKKAVQAVKGAPARRLQARFRRIIEPADPKPCCKDVL